MNEYICEICKNKIIFSEPINVDKFLCSRCEFIKIRLDYFLNNEYCRKYIREKLEEYDNRNKIINESEFILVCNYCLKPHNFDKVDKKETLNGYDFKCERCNKYTISKKIKVINGEI